MSTYAIGDLQGCFEALHKLLDLIAFDPAHDRIWLVGDLVNRGADSLAVLRWARDMGDTVTAVLGNHDLHLLAVAEGFVKPHRSDTLGGILTAPDCDELLTWLRHRPLAHAGEGYFMVHAGLLPQWTTTQALALAGEVEARLRAPNYRGFLAHLYGNQPDRWDESLHGIERLRLITNAMTRLRFCTPDGVMEFKTKGSPEQPPPGCVPWFQVPGRASIGSPIVFGHWSALGLRVETDCMALDTGCLWGGQLSALRLDDRRVFQVACAGLAGVTRWQ